MDAETKPPIDLGNCKVIFDPDMPSGEIHAINLQTAIDCGIITEQQIADGLAQTIRRLQDLTEAN
jgi:hypothetical protein